MTIFRNNITLPTMIICLIGMAVTLCLILFSKAHRTDTHQFHVKQETLLLRKSIEKEISLIVEKMKSMQSLFQSSSNVTRDEFKNFSSYLLHDSDAIQAVEWAPYMTPADRSYLEEKILSEGVKSFRIKEYGDNQALIEAGKRDIYFPIMYAEPFTGNIESIGYDRASDPEQMKAIEAAFKGERIVALVPENKKTGQYNADSIMLFAPVYTPDTVGVIVFNMRIDPIVALMRSQAAMPMAFALSDITDTQQHLSIYSTNSYTNLHGESVLSATEHFNLVEGSVWKLHAYAVNALPFLSKLEIAMLVAGVLFSVLMALYVRYREKQHQTTRHDADHNTQKLTNIIDKSGCAVITVDAEGAIHSFTQQASALFDYDPEEVIGKNISDLIQPHHHDMYPNFVKKYRETGKSNTIGKRQQLDAQSKEGVAIKIECIIIESIRKDDLLFTFLIRDVTQKMHKKQLLEESEARFHRAVTATSVGIWDWNIKTSEVYYSPHFREMLGYGASEFSATLDSFQRILHPDDEAKTINVIEEHLQQQDSYHIDCRLMHQNGSYLWFRITGQAIWQDGCVAYMSGSIASIEQLKGLEKSLMNQNTILKAVEDIEHLAHWKLELASQSVYWSSAASDIHGNEKAKDVHSLQDMISIYHADDRNIVQQRLDHSTNTGDSLHFTGRVVQENGEERLVEVSGVVEKDNMGRSLNIIGTFKDITERAAERSTLMRSSKALDSVNAGIIITDREGSIEWVNQTFENMTGYTLSESSGRKIGAVQQGDDITDQQALDYINNKMREGEGGEVDILSRHKNGEQYWSNIIVSPMLNHDEKIIGFAVLVIDITSRVNVEENLKQDHHDLGSEPQGRMNGVAVEARPYDIETIDIIPIIDGVYQELAALSTDKNMDVYLPVQHSVTVDCDPNKIHLVLHNLLSNAIKYSPDEKPIYIDCATDEQCLTVSVTDEGIGIPESELESVFDSLPYDRDVDYQNSDKESGLAVSKEIIEDHGGYMWALNNNHGGSILSFTLPLTQCPMQ